MRLKYVASALYLIFLFFSLFLLIPIVVSVIYKENTILPFLISAVISLILSLFFKLISKKEKENVKNKLEKINDLKKSEGLGIVVFAWIIAGILSSIPYLFFGLNPINSFFEGVSGITATGATIFTTYDYPKALIFWRSFSQWLGGAGIIVLFVAILPQFAVVGRQLFFAEAPGPTEEKITPRIKHTAMALWKIYLGLTILETILLCVFGMDKFDAVCNALSTVSCGGFSPNSESIMGYGSNIICWIIMIFIFLSGANLNLQYVAITKFKPQILFKSEEFRTYIMVFLGISSIVALSLFFKDKMSIIDSITQSAFQVISLMTSTGSVTSDYSNWDFTSKVLLFIAMLTGGCASSTSGGIKISRWILIFKTMKIEMKKMLHPNAVIITKLDKTIVSKEILGQLIIFVFFYFFIAGVSMLLITLIEHNVTIGISSSISAIGNIGPAFGNIIGPMGSYDSLNPITKLILIGNMLIGRLELIPFLVIFQKDFWGK